MQMIDKKCDQPTEERAVTTMVHDDVTSAALSASATMRASRRRALTGIRCTTVPVVRQVYAVPVAYMLLIRALQCIDAAYLTHAAVLSSFTNS